MEHMGSEGVETLEAELRGGKGEIAICSDRQLRQCKMELFKK